MLSDISPDKPLQVFFFTTEEKSNIVLDKMVTRIQ